MDTAFLLAMSTMGHVEPDLVRIVVCSAFALWVAWQTAVVVRTILESRRSRTRAPSPEPAAPAVPRLHLVAARAGTIGRHPGSLVSRDLGLLEGWLIGGGVESLEIHAFGACPECAARRVTCPHNEIELVDWMGRTGAWPRQRPEVLVDDRAVRRRLERALARRWKTAVPTAAREAT
jgi:hypothetical protein